MNRQESAEAIVRILPEDSTISVQVSWKGAVFNLLRAKDELVQRFVQRLGITCSKHHCVGGERKKAKKDKKKPNADEEGGKPADASSGIAVNILDKDGTRIADSMHIVDAMQRAACIEIEGEKISVSLNPPSIKKLEVYGKALVGCPLVASIQCEFCTPECFSLNWCWQGAVGSSDVESKSFTEGRMLWLSEESIGRSLILKAVDKQSGRIASCVRVGLVESIPGEWPERRLKSFGARRCSIEASKDVFIRVMSFNTLAAPYARTISATRDMYPYCPAQALDFVYRQPLLGREIARIDADLICLQECCYGTCTKFLTPLFGDKYHIRITLKANAMSEGCAMLIRKEKFEVLQECDFLFKNIFLESPAHREVVAHVKRLWPEFIDGVLPHMSTVFQLAVARHTASGAVFVFANTHLFFHPLARHIRLLQAICLLQQVHELRKQYQVGSTLPRVIFCGDLNCTPDQAIVELLMKGEIASDHPDWEHAADFRWEKDECASEEEQEGDVGTMPTLSASNGEKQSSPGANIAAAAESSENVDQRSFGMILQNPLGKLIDTYADEPMAFTNYVNGFQGTLDYILTTPGLRSVKRLPGVTEEELAPQGGLPNDSYPSDHLSIAVDLEIISD